MYNEKEIRFFFPVQTSHCNVVESFENKCRLLNHSCFSTFLPGQTWWPYWERDPTFTMFWFVQWVLHCLNNNKKEWVGKHLPAGLGKWSLLSRGATVVYKAVPPCSWQTEGEATPAPYLGCTSHRTFASMCPFLSLTTSYISHCSFLSGSVRVFVKPNFVASGHFPPESHTGSFICIWVTGLLRCPSPHGAWELWRWGLLLCHCCSPPRGPRQPTL